MAAWINIELMRPAQDTTGWTDGDGTYYRPTFEWQSKLLATRDDGTNFYVAITGMYDGATIKDILSKVETAMAQLSTFRICACTVDIPCRMHGKQQGGWKVK